MRVRPPPPAPKFSIARALSNLRTIQIQPVYHWRRTVRPITLGFPMSATVTSPRNIRSRRRSKRLRLNVPVEVIAFQGETELFREAAHVACVSAHGGLLVTVANLAAGQVLRLINRSTQEHQDCRVVHVESADNSKWAAGFEFLQPAVNFWQISFPPLSGRLAEESCN
jgi:hypothetical protein